MTNATTPPPAGPRKAPRWFGPLLFLLLAVIVLLVGLLASSIMERRWEAQRPMLVAAVNIPQWEPDNAVWGQNFPREYESYLQTKVTDTQTKFGGSTQRDYLDQDPNLVILWTGYAFSKDYKQPRGHYYSIQDVTSTKRITLNPQAAYATCFTCKSTDVPRLMSQMGVREFYHTPFMQMKEKITHPIGCQDCHDPTTMNLRITRPALREAFTAMGKDIDQATHQEMRSLVCAQCHVTYYFQDKYYLTFPWKNGLTVENILADYDDNGFSDFTNPISKTPMLKARHPDYELYTTGIHAYRGVSCADCHMPYRTEGGVKFTNHYVQSPLADISTSCAVCHRWSEQEIRQRVEAIQTKVWNGKLRAEDALVKAHFDVAAAMQAGITDEQLAAVRKMLRHAQYRWDYIRSSNGMGFHSPQESMRILMDAADEAEQVRVEIARLLATKGISQAPIYPDISTREKAAEVMKAFEKGNGVPLLPGKTGA